MSNQKWTGISATIGSSLSLGGISMLGDWIWARWLPEHQTWAGMLHGALLCLCIGFTLGLFERNTRAILIGSGGSILVGTIAAGAFYLSWSILKWGAMFAAWMLLWILMALLQNIMGRKRIWRDAIIRGCLAAIGSGAAFYSISGIWLSPPPGRSQLPLQFRCLELCIPTWHGGLDD